MPPLILVKPGRDRDPKLKKLEAESQYHLQAGIAKVALKTKATGEQKLDARGKPFYYSNAAASGFGTRELVRRSRGRRTVVVGFGKYA